ncbi:putative transporter efuK [Exophiala dermatitidis]
MVARLGNMSALRDFLGFIATVGGDISHVTAPPFILAPQSLTEFPCYWAERPALFTAPAHEPSPERRMLLVLKLYLASLQRQYYVGGTVKEGLKKPLNPFLGELFLCQYTDHDMTTEKPSSSTVRVISEQVSHHPPTTACYLSAYEDGVHAQAYSTQHTTLSGTSILIRQSGHAVLTVDKYNETYLLPLPDVWARGVLSGVPWPELNDTYKIVSSAGYTAEMRFIGKRTWGGERNLFEASIYRTADNKRKSLFTASGSWSAGFTIFDSAGNKKEFFDLRGPENQPVPMSISPLEQQSPWESRRAWGPTFDAIRKSEFTAVVHEKSKLENAQRHMRKLQHQEGRTWEAMFFRRSEQEDVDQVEQLLASLSSAEAHRLRGTNGCWRFDKEKERRWEEGRGSWRPISPMG